MKSNARESISTEATEETKDVESTHAEGAEEDAATEMPEWHIVDAETGVGISGAVLRFRGKAAAEGIETAEYEFTVNEQGILGPFAIPVADYLVSVSSPAHVERELVLEVEDWKKGKRVFELEALPVLIVHLLGGDGMDHEEFQVSLLGGSHKVQVEPDWTAKLPWRSGVDRAVTVHCHGSLEVSALFTEGPDSEQENGIAVRVGGAEEVAFRVMGAIEGSKRPVLVMQFASSLGYDAFVSDFADLDKETTLDMFEAGDLWVDVGVHRPDRTVDAIGRHHAVVEAAKVNQVTIEVGSHRTYLSFEALPGERITEGELFASGRKALFHTPTGGELDDEGRILLPHQSETEFYIGGFSGPVATQVLAADVPVAVDTRTAREVTVSLGQVVESQIELMDTATGSPLAGWRFAIVGGVTNQFFTEYTTRQDGGGASMRWHAAGAPCFELLWDGLWSPKTPVPITPGRVTIPITQRTICTFSSPGHTIAGIRHVGTGLEDAGLLAHGGVEISDGVDGRRYAGIPAGAYMVRLGGEEDWRGPFNVANRGPVQVVVSAD